MKYVVKWQKENGFPEKGSLSVVEESRETVAGRGRKALKERES